MPASFRHRATLWLCGSLLAGVAAAAPARFRIEVRDDGVYGVTYEALAAAGLHGEPRSAALVLRNRGEVVPLWVDDRGDGTFGPGDRIELVGRHLAGAVTYRDPYSPLNVYVLDVDGEAAARPAVAAPAVAGAGAAANLITRQHLERDVLLLRYSGENERQQELWYWGKLTQIDAAPFRQSLDLGDLDPAGTRPLEIRLRLRGWSRPTLKPDADTRDHRVEVTLDGKPLGAGEWNNEEGAYDLQLPALPARDVAPGTHELAVRVPKRPGSGGDPIVDVSVVDWIELVYPRQARLRRDQQRLELDGDTARLRLQAAGKGLVLYGDDGSRHAGKPASAGTFTFDGLASRRFDAVVDGKLRAPASVELDLPSRLAGIDRRADYLMIATPALRDALAPLVELRRRQGLAVEVVDVQDVYDDFHHGIPHPQALRDFIAHAWRQWQRPAPRFVLLVGDASWDLGDQPDDSHYPDAVYNPGHGTAFSHVESTPYAPEKRLHRNLIPTWTSGTYDGHAASDNWFVSVDGDDEKPELAIGRFPVVAAEEVAAIVDKIVRYESAPPPGPWRRNVLWISNEEPTFQAMTDRLAAQVGERGYAAEKIYARAGVTASEADQAAIGQAIDRGSLLVHFVGHGGRFIWRTGPPDWTKHRDLFNLDDLDKLAPSERLPVVLAMTCYSAPFDHPTADSIGEKFLRDPGRGAVAVVAASWRNAPSMGMSQGLLDNILRAPTLGEALQAAKRASGDRDFVEQYNLLGDPALRLPLPPPLQLAASAGGNGPAVSGDLGHAFSGRALVDWLDVAGNPVHSEEVAVADQRFTVAFRGDAATAALVAAVRIYAWNGETGVDAVGELRMPAMRPREGRR